MKNITELTEGQFEAEVLRAKEPVVVDFYAPWCGPCKMLSPLLEQLAEGYQKRLRFVKVNVDDAGRLAEEYEVTGVPTLTLFKDGESVDSVVGLASPSVLKSWLDNAANGGGPARKS